MSKFFKGKEEVFRTVKIKTLWPDGKESVQRFQAPPKQAYTAATVGQMVQDVSAKAREAHPLHEIKVVCVGKAQFNIVVSEPCFA